MLSNILKGASSAISAELLTQTRIVSGVSTYTFNNVTLGQSAQDRYIVVVSHFRAGSNLIHNSCTIGGVSATVAVARPLTTSGSAIFYALLPTGDLGTISVTLSGAATDLSITVFRLSGFGSTLDVNANSNGLTGTPVSISTTVNTKTRGCIIAGVRRSGSTPPLTADNHSLYESITHIASDATNQYRDGSFFPTKEITPETVSAAGTASGTMTIVAAHFSKTP